jgi:hypothetical protein
MPLLMPTRWPCDRESHGPGRAGGGGDRERRRARGGRPVGPSKIRTKRNLWQRTSENLALKTPPKMGAKKGAPAPSAGNPLWDRSTL